MHAHNEVHRKLNTCSLLSASPHTWCTPSDGEAACEHFAHLTGNSQRTPRSREPALRQYELPSLLSLKSADLLQRKSSRLGSPTPYLPDQHQEHINHQAGQSATCIWECHCLDYGDKPEVKGKNTKKDGCASSQMLLCALEVDGVLLLAMAEMISGTTATYTHKYPRMRSRWKESKAHSLYLASLGTKYLSL